MYTFHFCHLSTLQFCHLCTLFTFVTCVHFCHLCTLLSPVCTFVDTGGGWCGGQGHLFLPHSQQGHPHDDRTHHPQVNGLCIKQYVCVCVSRCMSNWLTAGTELCLSLIYVRDLFLHFIAWIFTIDGGFRGYQSRCFSLHP